MKSSMKGLLTTVAAALILFAGDVHSQKMPSGKISPSWQAYDVYRHMTVAEKEALFAGIEFVYEVPSGAFAQPGKPVSAWMLPGARKAGAGIVAGSVRSSSLSNVKHVRESGMKVCLMTASSWNDVISGLVLRPDYLVLEKGLDVAAIKAELLSARHAVVEAVQPFVVNYPSSVARAAGTDIRVMSYNILAEWAKNMPPASHRSKVVAEAICALAPDFAGLQEVQPCWYDSLTEKMKPYVFAKDPFKSTLCAIVYDSRKYKQVGGGLLPYTDKTLRCLRYALLEDLKSGKKYLVTNTHWDLTVAKRLANSKLMIEYIKKLQAEHPGVPVICTGDFNSYVEHEEMQLFLKNTGFADTVVAAGVKENKDMGSFVPPRFAVRPVLTRKHIDHVVISNDFDVLSAKLMVGPALFLSSDHLPVVSDLKFK